MPVIGNPTYWVQARLDADGKPSARVFVSVPYADRTVTSFLDVPEDDIPDSLAKSLDRLMEKSKRALELEATDLAYTAFSEARRRGEFDEDGKTIAPAPGEPGTMRSSTTATRSTEDE